jgi:hypothetical protein
MRRSMRTHARLVTFPFNFYIAAMKLHRRSLLLAAPVLIAGCQAHPKVYELQASRDDGCLCCGEWVKTLEATGRFRIAMFDQGDAPSFRRSVGVPEGMAGCHTALVEKYVVEGHVPAADILRLLDRRPKGVLGLVVPGMPRGSPGMEQPNGAKDAYIVFAFRAGGVTEEFAKYPGDA